MYFQRSRYCPPTDGLNTHYLKFHAHVCHMSMTFSILTHLTLLTRAYFAKIPPEIRRSGRLEVIFMLILARRYFELRAQSDSSFLLPSINLF